MKKPPQLQLDPYGHTEDPQQRDFIQVAKAFNNLTRFFIDLISNNIILETPTQDEHPNNRKGNKLRKKRELQPEVDNWQAQKHNHPDVSREYCNGNVSL